MKAFITSLLLFFTLSLFAQPQKGDIYVGFSNLRLQRIGVASNSGIRGIGNSSFFIAPNFGKFIANNTLVAGGISYFSSISDLSVVSMPNSSLLGINLLGAQYIGKGKLKGLSQIILSSNLLGGELRRTRRNITGNLGLGGAYFLNEFTSLQLLYNINIFTAIDGSSTDYFPTDLAPNIGLTVRTFLMRNREGIENLSALNSIKKGTKVLGVSAGLRNIAGSYFHSYAGDFTYFFADKLYGNIGLSSSRSNRSEGASVFSNFHFTLNAAYYLRMTDKIYTKFATGMSKTSTFSKFSLNGVENVFTDLDVLRWSTDLGFAIFLGRHKLEPGLNFRISNTQVKQVSLERISDFNPSLFLNYEWFLSQNFAFSTNANLLINDTSYFVVDNGITQEVFDVEQNRAIIDVGFKWYFSTPSE